MSAVAQGRGRPLRFLALVCAAWIVLRIAILWPETGSLPAAIRGVLPIGLAPPAASADAQPAGPMVAAPAPIVEPPNAGAGPARRIVDPARVRLAMLNLIQYGPPEYADGGPAPAAAATFETPAPQTRFQPATSRWSGSAWLSVRPGSGLSAAPGGELGGSQAGARVAWLIAPRRRIALFARVVSPLSGPGREGAVGVEWQPTGMALRLVAEQRFGNGPGGQGVAVVGGLDTRIPGGFRLESYGQAGAVRRQRIEPYVDGAARATHPIGGTRLALGGGAWGAAQRGAARVDLGPSATVELPVAGRSLRLAVDWRQRVAGNAAPGSGLAVTLGSDF